MDDLIYHSQLGIRHCQHTDCQHVNVNGTEVTLTVKNDLLGDMDDPSHDRHPLFYATDVSMGCPLCVRFLLLKIVIIGGPCENSTENVREN